MNAEFNWWLLVVGLVVGAGLVWFVLMDSRRREEDVDDRERPREALWLSRMLEEEGHDVSPETAERLLALHRAYLDAPPPDDPTPDATPTVTPEAPESPMTTGSELPADDRVGVQRRARDLGQ